MSKLLLVGGGGHCHSVLDSVMCQGLYEEIGIIDWTDSSCLGVPVVGNDDDIPTLFRKGWTDAFVTVGSLGNTYLRRRLFDMVKQYGLNIPIIIDPTAVVASDVQIFEGAYIGKHTVVNAGSIIGTCAIINTGAVIEHDCEVGSFAHVSPGVIVCGQVEIGTDAHVGAGSVVRQNIVIGTSALIGAGSVVVKDIPGGVTAYGNPCRVVRE